MSDQGHIFLHVHLRKESVKTLLSQGLCHTLFMNGRLLMSVHTNSIFIGEEKVSLKGARCMHSFARRLHGSESKSSAKETKGLILNGGWRYDLMGWFIDTFVFRGQWRELRQRTATLAQLQSGEQVLDVGCGTGTLAMEVARRVGSTGRVAGVDPSTQQIARARAKAARRHVPIDFQIGVIEHLAFPDQTFNVVLSTLMMHHLPADVKRQGLAEIARVLKPGGRLIIADFTHRSDRQ